MHFKLAAFNGRYIHSCLALFYVREELKKRLPAARLDLHQFTINDPYYKTLLKIAEGKPQAIFFSVYIWNGELIGRLLEDLAEILPETAFVLGGPQAGAFNRDELPPRCTVISGEIEGVEADFYRDLEKGALTPLYRCEAGLPFPSPYNEEDLTTELVNRHVYYESSRGCPFSCSYCLSSLERGITWKEMDLVRSELAFILRHHPKIIKFVDRTFNARPERAMAIWRFLAEQDGETVCHFEMAPDLFTEEMFDFLQELPPGRFQFELGIQSTSGRTLQAVNRVMNLDKVGRNIRRLAGFDNIHLHADLILGLPEETEATFRNSLRELFAMGPHYIQMGLLKVLPGTEICRTRGLRHCRKPPYEVLATAQMDRETTSRLFWLGECVEAFHNNRYFPSLFAYLRERGEDIVEFFESLLSVCREHDFFSRAATQPFLCELLLESMAGRADAILIRELLLYDWLRCGHRFIPDFLQKENLNELRKRLSRELDREMEPFFTSRSREEFFRKTVFAEFSGPALKTLGLIDREERGGIVCFLPEKNNSVYNHLETVFLAEPDR